MKTIISFIVIGFSIVSLTGCYTRVVTLDNNDDIYKEPETTIVVTPPPPDPCPYPGPVILLPAPSPHDPSPPVFNPDPPKEKIRNPESPTTGPESYSGNERDPIRNSGSRNNTDKRKR